MPCKQLGRLGVSSSQQSLPFFYNLREGLCGSLPETFKCYVLILKSSPGSESFTWEEKNSHYNDLTQSNVAMGREGPGSAPRCSDFPLPKLRAK